MHRCDHYILGMPDVKNPERAEHFGISTVEAMGMGAVPVVINVGGQPEIVEDGINGFLWKTTDDLMKKTNRLIKEPELWKKLSLAGMERSKVFIGDRFCNDVKEIIDK